MREVEYIVGSSTYASSRCLFMLSQESFQTARERKNVQSNDGVRKEKFNNSLPEFMNSN